MCESSNSGCMRKDEHGEGGMSLTLFFYIIKNILKYSMKNKSLPFIFQKSYSKIDIISEFLKILKIKFINR